MSFSIKAKTLWPDVQCPEDVAVRLGVNLDHVRWLARSDHRNLSYWRDGMNDSRLFQGQKKLKKADHDHWIGDGFSYRLRILVAAEDKV